jgi:colanic acid biosynthesis glycosyl transferase WcaI
MRVLLLNQCFHPDHVATAQHLTELAHGLVAAGHEVTAVASSRGYDDPEIRYPVRETWQGIDIRRIWVPGLGKRSRWRRFVDFAIFWLNATWILLRLPKFDVTVCLTSPPLISSLGTVMALLKGGQVVPWVMDLNPDEAVAAGWLKQGKLPERFMSAIQNWTFSKAATIVALDRFMADRLRAKFIAADSIHTDAPWSQDDVVHYDPEGRQAFRAAHGLRDKFVVMYSGNHSPCHPLDTLLEAAQSLAGTDPRVHFLFVGGGSELKKVQRYKAEQSLSNISTLPYQPLDQLSGSLSAADLHLVVMGSPFIGMIHPCKIYNVLALGLPHLCLGPAESHLRDLAARLPDPRYSLVASHGDSVGLAQQLREAAKVGALPPSEDLRKLAAEFSVSVLLPRMVQVIETAGGASR